MQKIFESASKIVFIVMAIGAVVGFFTGFLSENNFMILAGAAFTFYFSNKGDTSLPFGGK
jgi:putative solute:sodium symporter small subunit